MTKMKTMVLAVLTALVVAQTLVAQEHRLWIGLSQNRVLLDAVLRSVNEESITVVKDGRVLNVSFNEIEQCREIRGGIITRGAVAGASMGLVIGGTIGILGEPREERGLRIGTSALAAAIVGAIIGSVIESAPDEDEILNLREKTLAEKREIFGQILKRPIE